MISKGNALIDFKGKYPMTALFLINWKPQVKFKKETKLEKIIFFYIVNFVCPFNRVTRKSTRVWGSRDMYTAGT